MRSTIQELELRLGELNQIAKLDLIDDADFEELIELFTQGMEIREHLRHRDAVGLILDNECINWLKDGWNNFQHVDELIFADRRPDPLTFVFLSSSAGNEVSCGDYGVQLPF